MKKRALDADTATEDLRAKNQSDRSALEVSDALLTWR